MVSVKYETPETDVCVKFPTGSDGGSFKPEPQLFSSLFQVVCVSKPYQMLTIALADGCMALQSLEMYVPSPKKSEQGIVNT